MKTQLSVLVAGLLLGMFASGANAAASYCDVAGSPNTDGLQYSDLKFNGADSDDCYGVVISDNESLADIIALDWDVAADASDDWLLLDKTDSVVGAVQGLSFVLTSDTTKPDGNWLLTVTDTNAGDPENLPVTMDLVFALKASNAWAAYLFEDVSVDGNDSGTYHIAFNGPGGQTAGFSHLSLYGRFTEDGGGDDDVIPEPGVLFLMGAGLLGLGMARRRKSA